MTNIIDSTNIQEDKSLNDSNNTFHSIGTSESTSYCVLHKTNGHNTLFSQLVEFRMDRCAQITEKLYMVSLFLHGSRTLHITSHRSPQPMRQCVAAHVHLCIFPIKLTFLNYPDVKFSENFFTSITFCALQHIQKLEVLYFKNRTFRISSSFQKSVSPRVFTLVTIFFYR